MEHDVMHEVVVVGAGPAGLATAIGLAARGVSTALVTGPDLDDQAQMRAFWRDGTPPVVANAERVGFHCLVIAGNVRRPSPPDGNTCLSLSSFRVTLLRVTRIKAKRGRLRKGAESYGKARI